MFARLIAKLFAQATRTPIHRTRSNAEALEARDVPAQFWWVGNQDPLDYDDTNAAYPGNWLYHSMS